MTAPESPAGDTQDAAPWTDGPPTEQMPIVERVTSGEQRAPRRTGERGEELTRAPARERTRVLKLRLAPPAVLSRLGHRRKSAGQDEAAWVDRLGDSAGRGFARLTVAPALLLTAWLVPGLPLLLAGEFLPVPMLLIAAPLFAALMVNVLHRIPARWTTDLPGQDRDRAWMGWFAMIGTTLVAGGFGAWQVVLRSPSVISTRTPGASFQAGYWIAQHGSLPIPGSLSAFGGSQAALHLSSIGFFQQGHVVVPAVSAGLPMLLSAGFWTNGMGGGAVVGPVLGGLAVLCFGGLVGRLAGRQWAPAGALALALTLPELYTSRDAFSETAVQVVLFGGLSLVVDALTVSRRADGGTQAESNTGLTRTETIATGTLGSADARPAGQVPGSATEPGAGSTTGLLAFADAWSRRAEASLADRWRRLAAGSRAFSWRDMAAPRRAAAARPSRATERGPQRHRLTWQGVAAWSRTLSWRGLASWVASLPTPERMLAALGGLSLGMISLFSLGSLVYLLAVIAVAGVMIAARRTTGLAFALGLCVGVGYGIAAGYVLARTLVDSLAPTLEVIGRDAVAVAVVTVVITLLLRGSRARLSARRAPARRPLRWLPGLAAAAVIAGATGLAVRPYLQTVRGSLGRAEANYVAVLQHAAGLRTDPTRLYSEDTLYWVIWYAGIATVLLGAFGAAVLLRRCLRSALSWRDSSGAALNWALPMAVVLSGSAAVLWQPFTVPDQPWASRRLVPVVLPGLILCATWAAAWLTRRARERGASTVTGSVVAAFCVGAMLVPSVSTSFGAGLSHSGVAGGLKASVGGLAQHRVGTGETDAVRGLCSSIGRSSSVVIVDRRVAADFTQVIRGVCGVPVSWMAQSSPASAVDVVLAGVARAGRHPVVLGANPGEVGAFGGRPVLILNLVTTQNSHQLTQPPGAPQPARYVIWMAAGSAPNTGI